MIKAVFLDYTGTVAEENSKYATELLSRCCKNSDMESMQAMLSFWWEQMEKLEAESYGENFLTEDEIVDELLDLCARQIHLKENFAQLHRLFQKHWMYAPAFQDVKPFFEACPVPIYMITNNDFPYIQEGMKDKGLHPAGFVCGELVRAYKPRRELFEKALSISNCRADEAVHIGDSFSSDVKGALSVGIRPILLDRKGKAQLQDVTVVTSLLEVLPILREERSEAQKNEK